MCIYFALGVSLSRRPLSLASPHRPPFPALHPDIKRRPILLACLLAFVLHITCHPRSLDNNTCTYYLRPTLLTSFVSCSPRNHPSYHQSYHEDSKPRKVTANNFPTLSPQLPYRNLVLSDTISRPSHREPSKQNKIKMCRKATCESCGTYSNPRPPISHPLPNYLASFSLLPSCFSSTSISETQRPSFFFFLSLHCTN